MFFKIAWELMLFMVVKARSAWNKGRAESSDVCWKYISTEERRRRVFVQMLLAMRRLVRISPVKGGFS